MPNEVLNSNHVKVSWHFFYIFGEKFIHTSFYRILPITKQSARSFILLRPLFYVHVQGEMYMGKLWKNKYANSYTAQTGWFIPFLKEYGSIYISFTCISANSCCANNFQIRRKKRAGYFFTSCSGLDGWCFL